MPDGQEPQPGATPLEVKDADALAAARNELANVGIDSTTKLSSEGYADRQTTDGQDLTKTNPEPNLDAFKGARLNPEAFTPEALDRVSEKIARYFKAKTEGVDGEPLSGIPLELTLESARAEVNSRTQKMLLEVASGSTGLERFQQLKETALDTLILKSVVDLDKFEKASDAKVARYMGSDSESATAAQIQERGFGLFEKAISEPHDLSSMLDAGSIRDRFVDNLAKVGRYIRPDLVTKPIDENPEPKLPTTPQPPTQS